MHLRSVTPVSPSVALGLRANSELGLFLDLIALVTVDEWYRKIAYIKCTGQVFVWFMADGERYRDSIDRTHKVIGDFFGFWPLVAYPPTRSKIERRACPHFDRPFWVIGGFFGFRPLVAQSPARSKTGRRTCQIKN